MECEIKLHDLFSIFPMNTPFIWFNFQRDCCLRKGPKFSILLCESWFVHVVSYFLLSKAVVSENRCRFKISLTFLKSVVSIVITAFLEIGTLLFLPVFGSSHFKNIGMFDDEDGESPLGLKDEDKVWTISTMMRAVSFLDRFGSPFCTTSLKVVMHFEEVFNVKFLPL